jgi:predicted Kef-type K+ transport protein
MGEFLIYGIIAHLIGDYILQNDYIANKKTKETIPALIHVSLYSIPFFFIVGFSYELLFIVSTHFFIDRFRLAIYWIKLINWNWNSKNFGFDNEKPLWMSVWLMIIYDNTFHIIFNSLAIYHYFK